MDPEPGTSQGELRPASPPHLEDLLALPRASWADVVAHARRVLQGLDVSLRTPAIQRLQAAPANKLLSGRSRRALAEVFAEGGAAWVALHARLRDAGVGEDLSFLLDGQRPATSSAPAVDAQDEGQAERLVPAQDLDRAKQKARTLREERDEARRRADGAATRLQAAEAAAAQDEQTITRLEREVADLREQVAAADRDREKAVDRERRRQEAALTKVRDEATSLRRADEDRRKASLERERRALADAERARQREVEERELVRARRAGGSDLAAPGRPSEFPPGVAPGTTSHAKALLAPGRRILVDGYNVAKTQRPDLADEAGERQWLEDALTNLIAMRHVSVEVYWDGDQRDGSQMRRGELRIAFSPRAVTADDDIEFAIAASPDDEPLVVVTDDRGLRDRLAPYRVDLLGTQPFGWALRG